MNVCQTTIVRDAWARAEVSGAWLGHTSAMVWSTTSAWNVSAPEQLEPQYAAALGTHPQRTGKTADVRESSMPAAPKVVGIIRTRAASATPLYLSGIGPRDPPDGDAGNVARRHGVRHRTTSRRRPAPGSPTRAVPEASGARWTTWSTSPSTSPTWPATSRPLQRGLGEFFPDAATRPAAPRWASRRCRRPFAIELKCIAVLEGVNMPLPGPINLQAWIDEHRHLSEAAGRQQVHRRRRVHRDDRRRPEPRAPTTTEEARNGSTSSKARWSCASRKTV